ncbi:MAG: hypothetical protein GY874_07435 [Desulfobacteraceae bacterium]|nr:hypothetical protein [Desulfobacteraceae bacterium]
MLLNTPISLLISRPKKAAFHNLCLPDVKIPVYVKSLLGLNLNFCPQPTKSSSHKQVSLDRLRKDLYTRILFANEEKNDENSDDKDLGLRCKNEEWNPPEPQPELSERCNNFITALNSRFQKSRKCQSNLLPTQLAALKWLEDNPQLIVFNADKNLGPCIIERERYLDLALRDHLGDKNTYRQLNEAEAKTRLKSMMGTIDSFVKVFGKKIGPNNTKYIIRKLSQVNLKNAAARFYLTAKIHKTPLKTRPIVSTCGGLLEGIAKYTDRVLQHIIKHLPYVATSSKEVVRDLCAKKWPSQTRLFTWDAVSMYTNIHLDHAWPVIKNFLNHDVLGKNIVLQEKISVDALGAALEIIMKNSLFQFGDSFWLQLSGTSMGTPPAPPYATLYYCIHEMAIIHQFEEISYHKRYIDDGGSLWTSMSENREDDDRRWSEFKALANDFGTDHEFFQGNEKQRPLVWEFSERENSAIFLDLNLRIANGIISSTIYEKKLNLYLYIPPHSCHPPGVLKGLIYGAILRVKSLCTSENDYIPAIQRTFDRLLVRGYEREAILPIFLQAIKSIMSNTSMDRTAAKSNDENPKPIRLHLPFNKADPSSRWLRSQFELTMLAPPNNKPIKNITANHRFPGPVDFERITTCYHKQKSLRNILAPRKLRLGDGFSVKEYLNPKINT